VERSKRTTTKNVALLALLSLASVLVLAACGGGDPTPTPRPAATSTPIPTATPTLAPGVPTPTPAPPTPTPAPPTPTAVPTVDFSGMTGRVMVGYSPGGTFDFWARELARHMPQYLPGKPNLIVQNMPGAGGRRMINWMTNVANPNGLTFGTADRGGYFGNVLNEPGVEYVWNELSFVGTPEQTANLFYIRAATGIEQLEDLATIDKPVKCGSTSPGSNATFIAYKFVQEFMGGKIDIVSGYPGGTEISLAVDRGEIDCFTQSSSAYFSREPFLSWEKAGFANKLSVTSQERIPELPNVRTVWEIIDKLNLGAEDRALTSVMFGSDSFGRPFFGPPGIEPHVLDVVREAFNKTLKDPEFIADAKQRGVPLTPLSGVELQKLANEVMAIDPATVKRLKALLSG